MDDWGWGNLDIHNPGNPEIVTPNINSIITKEGILLDRHYVFKCAQHASLVDAPPRIYALLYTRPSPCRLLTVPFRAAIGP